MSDAIAVEVVHALPGQVQRIALRLAAGTTVAQALTTPEVVALYPDAATLPAGIFGKRCEPQQRLRDGDRIELYRALIADPKTARRERADAAKSKG